MPTELYSAYESHAVLARMLAIHTTWIINKKMVPLCCAFNWRRGKIPDQRRHSFNTNLHSLQSSVPSITSTPSTYGHSLFFNRSLIQVSWVHSLSKLIKHHLFQVLLQLHCLLISCCHNMEKKKNVKNRIKAFQKGSCWLAFSLTWV